MHEKDILRLAVRLLGLVFVYHALQVIPPAIGQMIGSFPEVAGDVIIRRGSFGRFVAGVLMIAWPLLIAWWLLRGAPFLMKIAYMHTIRGSIDRNIGEAPDHNANSSP